MGTFQFWKPDNKKLKRTSGWNVDNGDLWKRKRNQKHHHAEEYIWTGFTSARSDPPELRLFSGEKLASWTVAAQANVSH